MGNEKCRNQATGRWHVTALASRRADIPVFQIDLQHRARRLVWAQCLPGELFRTGETDGLRKRMAIRLCQPLGVTPPITGKMTPVT
jgi:hypothetical protein